MTSLVSKQNIKDLNDDGFVHLKSIFTKNEIGLIDDAIQSNINSPSPFARNFNQENNSSSFFMDFNNWMRLPLIENICRLTKLINIVTKLTGSKKCWLFHDHVLVKSGNAIPTPVHHDRPYHIFKGNLNCSIWIPVGDVERKSSLIFYKSSHKTGKLFLPKAFIDGENIGSDKVNFTDLDTFDINDYKATDFEMKSGDAIVFFNNCLHSSHRHRSNNERRAMSIRYLLDGASLTKKYVNATPPFDRMGVKIIEDCVVPETHFPLLKE